MIVKKPKTNGMTIDLTGPQGNAFYLLATAKSLSKQLELDSNKVMNEMKSGDYDNVVKVFDGYFGSFVTLYN